MRKHERLAMSVILGIAAPIFLVGAAAAPPKPGQSTTPPVAGRASFPARPTPTRTPWPDVVVNRVWISSAEALPAASALSRRIQAGDTITLACEIETLNGVPPNSFHVNWAIDGRRTCGDGEWALTNPPTCAFLWPYQGRVIAAITYVPRTAGTHAYCCEANLDRSLDHFEEGRRGNNWKEVSFAVTPRVSRPDTLTDTKPPTAVPRGPKIWR